MVALGDALHLGGGNGVGDVLHLAVALVRHGLVVVRVVADVAVDVLLEAADAELHAGGAGLDPGP